MKFVPAFASAALLSALILSPVVQAAPAAKFSAALSKTTLMDDAIDANAVILSSQLHTANKKDLLIGVSLEAGLYTETSVKGKTGSKESASAEAGITVTVYVDGVPAEPGTITFQKRYQQLSAVMGGVIESCTFSSDSDGDGIVDEDLTIVIEDDCIVTDEEISLIQNTMSAHHFNVVMPNVSAGVHEITVEAEIASQTQILEGEDSGTNSATATALVGKGSLTIQETRAINQDGGIVVMD